MEVKSKVWLEKEGKSIFGDGRMSLLKAIERCGSIHKAAQEVNLSYRHCWSSIKAMEERLGMNLVERWVGGRDGGGARLTHEAREFMKKFDQLQEGIDQIVNERFEEVFGHDEAQ